MFIWIIRDGILIASKSFLDLPVREDLVTGLLSALNTFIVTEFNESIESIEMGGLNWIYYYMEEEGLLFVAAEIKDVKIETVKSRLSFIKEDFMMEYVKGKDWKDWDGNINIYEPFEEKIEKFYNHWMIAEGLETYADLFDIIGIFQQLLNLIHKLIETQIDSNKRDRIIKSVEFYTRNFKKRVDILYSEELQKISYSSEKGFNIFDIDPSKCNISIVKKQLMNYFAEIIRTIKKELGQELSLLYFNEQKIFSFIFKNLALLKKYQLGDYILQIILNI